MDLTRRSLLLAALAAATLAACGPSAALKEARGARYQGTRDEVFLAVTNALAAEKYKIDRSDPEQAVLLTRGRWFEKDGTYEDKAADTSDKVTADDGSVFLAYMVQVVGDSPPYQVKVEPVVEQVRAGFSARYPMKRDNPELPGWIIGKTDMLEVSLHKRLKGKFIAPPGTTAPAAQ